MSAARGPDDATRPDPGQPVQHAHGPAGEAEPVDRVERVWPSPAVWLGALVLAGFCAVVALPFGDGAGEATFAVSLIVMVATLVRASPVIGVRGGELVAGRAHVPVSLLGEVTALDAAAMRAAHGPDLDARAYLCLRGWVRSGLRAELVDPQDPTPYWLVSCRRPEWLREGVEQARGRA